MQKEGRFTCFDQYCNRHSQEESKAHVYWLILQSTQPGRKQGSRVLINNAIDTASRKGRLTCIDQYCNWHRQQERKIHVYWSILQSTPPGNSKVHVYWSILQSTPQARKEVSRVLINNSIDTTRKIARFTCIDQYCNQHRQPVWIISINTSWQS